MDTRNFIDRVVPSDGVYFIASSYVKSDGSTGLRHTKLTDGTRLQIVIDQLNSQNKDTYIAVGSFASTKSRTKNNVKSKKSFYLDLDCGPGKDFATQKEAVTALFAFIKESGIPHYSILVNSGNGIHAYWTLETPIGEETWTTVANSLKKKCAALKLPADNAVTADSARVLRIPGTINFKDPTNTKLCSIIGKDHGDVSLDAMKDALRNVAPVLTLVPNASTVNVPAVGNDLSNGSNYTAPAAEQVFEKCPTMKYSLDTGGANDSQPLWASILHILSFTANGRDYIHQVSDQHAGYSKNATEVKFDEKILAKVDRPDIGPTGCDKFELMGGTQCHGCPYRGGVVKNPLLTVRHRMANELPYNYMMDGGGMYVKVMEEVDGEEVPQWSRISPYKIFDAEINIPPGEVSQFFRFKYSIGTSNTHVAEYAASDMTNPKTFGELLGYSNINLHPEQVKGVHRLMTSWKQQMEAAKFISSSPNKMGWTADANGKVGFALADKILWEDGKETANPLPSPELLKHYTSIGKLKPWKKAADLILGHPNVELQITLATAFAAPLMHMAGTPGAVLAIVSQASGIGKSKALHTAQSVWGKPNQINSMDDTGNSMIRKMGILNNLPAYWDELHMSQGNDGLDEFTNMIFRLAQGKEKTRLTSNIKFQSSGEWNTLITVVSNDSIHDHLRLHRGGTPAPLMRVLELEILKTKISNDNLSKALQTFHTLEKNYGVAGQIYAEYIVKHHADLKVKIMNYIARVSGMKYMNQSERMRIALIATVIIGADAANAAGLTNFKTADMARRLIGAILPRVNPNGQIGEQSLSVQEILSEYMTEFAQQTNKTDNFQTKGGRGQIAVISEPRVLPVRVHVADTLSRVRVEESHLRNWITHKYGGGSRIIERLRALPNTTQTRGSLSAGLKSDITGRPRLIELPLP